VNAHDLRDPQARHLVQLATHPSPAFLWSHEDREALLAGARALEREFRRREEDTREVPK